MLYIDEINQQILPLARLFDISRKDLMRDVKTMVPFWKTNKVLRFMVLFFRKLVMSRTARQAMKEEKEAATDPVVGTQERGEMSISRKALTKNIG